MFLDNFIRLKLLFHSKVPNSKWDYHFWVLTISSIGRNYCFFQNYQSQSWIINLTQWSMYIHGKCQLVIEGHKISIMNIKNKALAWESVSCLKLFTLSWQLTRILKTPVKHLLTWTREYALVGILKGGRGRTPWGPPYYIIHKFHN